MFASSTVGMWPHSFLPKTPQKKWKLALDFQVYSNSRSPTPVQMRVSYRLQALVSFLGISFFACNAMYASIRPGHVDLLDISPGSAGFSNVDTELRLGPPNQHPAAKPCSHQGLTFSFHQPIICMKPLPSLQFITNSHPASNLDHRGPPMLPELPNVDTELRLAPVNPNLRGTTVVPIGLAFLSPTYSEEFLRFPGAIVNEKFNLDPTTLANYRVKLAKNRRQRYQATSIRRAFRPAHYVSSQLP
ncbi:hypothetical protein H4Q26_015284 [Puccinia striiformis f. sp. tritici PST-130]|nr:hypothetical protein H4Q26_015284 [Puccinia striiformis f. sp. tritici PST-130]